MNKDFINEKKIIGHGNPISFNNLRIIDKKSEDLMCKIEYKGNIESGFFFKQNMKSIKYYNKNFLMTNSHVLDDDIDLFNNKNNEY